jgi:hypothetical protein
MAFGLQAALVLAVGLIALVVTAAAVALNIGLAHQWLPPSSSEGPASTVAAGLGLGALLAGVDAMLSRLGPDTAPNWASLEGASAFAPTVAVLLSPVGQWITGTALLLVVVAALHAGTLGWSRRRVPFAALTLLVGLVLTGSGSVESPLLWLGGGLAAGAVLLATYVFVLRHQFALLPLATAVETALGAMGEGLMRGFAGALVGAVVGAILVLALSYLWSRALSSDTAEVADGSSV